MNGKPVLSAQKVVRIALVTETFPPEVNGVAMTVGRMLDGLLERERCSSVGIQKRFSPECEPVKISPRTMHREISSCSRAPPKPLVT
jgi:hypothetical protein